MKTSLPLQPICAPAIQYDPPAAYPNLGKNLDKKLEQILSRVFLLQSHLSKFGQGTWTRNLDNRRALLRSLEHMVTRHQVLLCKRKTRDRICPSSLSNFLSRSNANQAKSCKICHIKNRANGLAIDAGRSTQCLKPFFPKKN